MKKEGQPSLEDPGDSGSFFVTVFRVVIFFPTLGSAHHSLSWRVGVQPGPSCVLNQSNLPIVILERRLKDPLAMMISLSPCVWGVKQPGDESVPIRNDTKSTVKHQAKFIVN
jgi:hypothetical protein